MQIGPLPWTWDQVNHPSYANQWPPFAQSFLNIKRSINNKWEQIPPDIALWCQQPLCAWIDTKTYRVAENACYWDLSSFFMKKSDRGKRKWYQQSYVMNEICWNVSSIIFAAAILNTSITNIIYTSCPDWYQHQKGYQILVHQSWRAEAVRTSLLPSYQRLTPHTFYTKVIYKEVAAKIATFEVINNFHRRRMTSLNTTRHTQVTFVETRSL